MFVISYSVTYCIYIPEKNWDFVLIIIVQFLMSANSQIRYGLQIVFVCLYITPSHYHHCCKIICKHWTWNVCQIYFVECVSKIEHILSVIHYSIYGAVCFQFTQFPHDDWENILLCLIIIIKSEVWTIIHCLGLGHETMVCAVCLFIFLLEWQVFLWHSNKNNCNPTIILFPCKAIAIINRYWSVRYFCQECSRPITGDAYGRPYADNALKSRPLCIRMQTSYIPCSLYVLCWILFAYSRTPLAYSCNVIADAIWEIHIYLPGISLPP